MAEILEIVMTVLFLLMHILTGAYAIKMVTVRFIERKYFLFGLWLMTVLAQVIMMVRILSLT